MWRANDYFRLMNESNRIYGIIGIVGILWTRLAICSSVLVLQIQLVWIIHLFYWESEIFWSPICSPFSICLPFLKVWRFIGTDRNQNNHQFTNGVLVIFDIPWILRPRSNGDRCVWCIQWNTLQCKLVLISEWTATNDDDIHENCSTANRCWLRK